MLQRSEGASGGGVAAALATGAAAAAAAAATTNGQPHTGNLFSDAASEISRVCLPAFPFYLEHNCKEIEIYKFRFIL